MFDPEIVDRAKSYYHNMDRETAIEIAKETVEEWDYNEDPHGYCHVRPMLVRLIQEAEKSE